MSLIPNSDPDIDELRRILAEVLHSDLSLERDDLYTQIAECFPRKMTFSIIISETRRFSLSKTDTSSERLYLPYISIRVYDSSFFPFKFPNDISELIRYSSQHGFIVDERPKSTIISNIDNIIIRKSLNICEQIILSFYYVCGHHDNFMSNASRRFVKNYLKKQRSTNTSQVIQAIRTQTNCDILYLTYHLDDMIFNVVDDSSNIYPQLSNDKRFEIDLKRAAAYPGTFSGRTLDNYHYVIDVSTADHSYNSLFNIDYSSKNQGLFGHIKRHILIICKLSKELGMDAIKFGPHLFRSQLAIDTFSERERLIFDIHNRVSQAERNFSANPPKTRSKIEYVIKQEIIKIVDSTIQVTSSQLIIVRLINPFNKKLKVVAVSSQSGNISGLLDIDVSDNQSDIVSSYRDSQRKSFSKIPSYTNSIKINDDDVVSGFVFPIIVGCIPRGTIECYSTRPDQLQFDEDYLNAIANAIGDAARHLEATADTAWISRLSFLHSARHELENFLPLLQNKDEHLYASLRATLMKYSGVGPMPWNVSQGGTKLVDQVRFHFDDAVDDRKNLNELTSKIQTMEELLKPDDGFRFIFSEVIATLVVNAKRHSDLRSMDFSFDISESGGMNKNLIIKYRSSDKQIQPDRADCVSTSPIPAWKGETFHYGLFLVSAQVRMNGGAVYVNTDGPLKYDVIPFELCFLLPLYPLGDDGAN